MPGLHGFPNKVGVQEICRTGEGRIYIKVVILLFNAFQWFVKRLNPVASLDFNHEPLKEHLLSESLSKDIVVFFNNHVERTHHFWSFPTERGERERERETVLDLQSLMSSISLS